MEERKYGVSPIRGFFASESFLGGTAEHHAEQGGHSGVTDGVSS